MASCPGAFHFVDVHERRLSIVNCHPSAQHATCLLILFSSVRWANNIAKLLDLVEKSCGQIQKECMRHQVTLNV